MAPLAAGVFSHRRSSGVSLAAAIILESRGGAVRLSPTELAQQGVLRLPLPASVSIEVGFAVPNEDQLGRHAELPELSGSTSSMVARSVSRSNGLGRARMPSLDNMSWCSCND